MGPYNPSARTFNQPLAQVSRPSLGTLTLARMSGGPLLSPIGALSSLLCSLLLNCVLYSLFSPVLLCSSAILSSVLFALCSLLSALCSVLSLLSALCSLLFCALCSLLSALFSSVLFALCSLLSALSSLPSALCSLLPAILCFLFSGPCPSFPPLYSLLSALCLLCSFVLSALCLPLFSALCSLFLVASEINNWLLCTNFELSGKIIKRDNFEYQ
jgi:hypothetical protein